MADSLNQSSASWDGTKQKDEFCKDARSIGACATYLDQTLTSLGYPALDLPAAVPSDEECIRLINVLFLITEKHKRRGGQQDDLESKIHRLTDDVSRMSYKSEAYKEQLEVSSRAQAQLEEEKRQLMKNNKIMQRELKATQEEFKKMKLNMQRNLTQYQHDAKKREREATKLKLRLQKLLQQKSTERERGIEILNALQKKGGRKKWNAGNQAEEDMQQMIICNYEERQKELAHENQDLRQSLIALQTDLVDVLNKLELTETQLSEVQETANRSFTSIEPLAEGHFDMPFELSQSRIESSLKAKMQALKKRISDPHLTARLSMEWPPANTQPSDDVEPLKEKIETYRQVIEDQQVQLLELQSKSPFDDDSSGPSRSFLSDSRLIHETEELEIEKERLESEKLAFEAERKRFTAGAIRLGKEKDKLVAEQRRIELMALTSTPIKGQPANPVTPSHTASKAQITRLLMTTPRRTNNPSSGLMQESDSHSMSPSHNHSRYSRSIRGDYSTALEGTGYRNSDEVARTIERAASPGVDLSRYFTQGVNYDA